MDHKERRVAVTAENSQFLKNSGWLNHQQLKQIKVAVDVYTAL